MDDDIVSYIKISALARDFFLIAFWILGATLGLHRAVLGLGSSRTRSSGSRAFGVLFLGSCLSWCILLAFKHLPFFHTFSGLVPLVMGTLIASQTCLHHWLFRLAWLEAFLSVWVAIFLLGAGLAAYQTLSAGPLAERRLIQPELWIDPAIQQPLEGPKNSEQYDSHKQ